MIKTILEKRIRVGAYVNASQSLTSEKIDFLKSIRSRSFNKIHVKKVKKTNNTPKDSVKMQSVFVV